MNDERKIQDDAYVPIACSVHDKLEDSAVRGTVAHLVVRDGDGNSVELQDRIKDVFARDGVEYLRTGGGQEIRLDRIESVNGERVTLEAEGS